MAEDLADPSTPPGKRGGWRKAATFDQERVVRRYLSAVETTRPGRGTKRTADAIGNRITKVDEMLVSADPLRRVHLIQERIELHAEYVRITNGNTGDPSQVERDFTRVARSYGDRNGITYAAWRQVGVDAKVLERAGIHKAEKKPPPAALRAAEQAAEADRKKPGPDRSVPVNGAREPTPAPAEAKVTEAKVTQAKVTEARVPEAQAPEATAPEAQAPDLEGPGAKPKARAKDAGETTEAVSMDDLAALLADATADPSPVASSTQPRLGDDAASTGDAAPAPRRNSRLAADDGDARA